MKFNYIYLTLLALLFSCNDYLEESPNSNYDIEINDVDKISEVITSAYPRASYFPFLEPRTDNVSEREGGEYYRLNESMYLWQDFDNEDLDTPLNYWNECYKGIAEVNQALESLKLFEEKTPRIKALYGEALVLRAYLHFMLVNIWSEAYNPTTADTDLGIPYLTKPERNAFPEYGRGTVEETYQKIQEDLEIGLPLIQDKYYKQSKYHFNKNAAYAFATRFYLYKGDWDKVLTYSEYVLGLDPYTKLRNWAVYRDYDFSVKEHYTNATENANLLITPTETRWNRRFKTERYGLDYNKNKLLFQTLSPTLDIVFYYSGKVSGVEGSSAKYIDKFRDFSTFESTGLNPRGVYSDQVLFTTDEVLLNRIEALAMKERYDDAILDLRSYLKAKTSAPLLNDEIKYAFSNAQDLYTSSFQYLSFFQADLVAFAAELRRREFVHEGLRWFDIKRFHLSVDRNIPGEPLVLDKVLKREDRRKVLQIPADAINYGLTPNPR